ncbi:MAG: hypothetical protein U1F46_08825 [Marinagarivorans sp.]
MVLVIEAFINEISLNAKFSFNVSEMDQTIRDFLTKLEAFRDLPGITHAQFKSQLLMNVRVIGGPFVSAVNLHASKELKALFFSKLFERTSDWENHKVHSANDNYYYEDVLVTNSSMAELAERTRQSNYIGSLFCFSPSKFDGLDICKVVKNDKDRIEIKNFLNPSEFSKWLQNASVWIDTRYDTSSKSPPEDYHTCLLDIEKYSVTKYKNQGRKVYQHSLNQRYFVVDNLHFGTAAHIEVWSKRGEHMGEIGLDGLVLDESKRDPKKDNPDWL